jgi:Zn-dependent protease
MVFMNLLLAVFNMLPIPPLDGSRIVDGMVSREYRDSWDQIASIGPILLGVAIVALVFLGGITRFEQVAWRLEALFGG